MKRGRRPVEFDPQEMTYLLTVEEVAKLFGVTPPSVYAWVRKKQIACHRIPVPGSTTPIDKSTSPLYFTTDACMKWAQARHQLGE